MCDEYTYDEYTYITKAIELTAGKAAATVIKDSKKTVLHGVKKKFLI